jgi:hypothetical protein
MKAIRKVLFLALIGAGIFTTSMYAQNNKSSNAKVPVSLKDGGVYKFSADWVYPMSGRAKNLMPSYDVIFSKDTVSGQLPYFGVASSVPYGSNDGGVNFNTSKFTLDESVDKKGRYKVHYKMKESSDILDATFTIYKDGTADLQLTFLQRQSISYRGTFKAVPKG